MTLREQLLHIADVYCRSSERSETRVSTQIFSGGLRIQKIREGGDIGTMSFERAMAWFSENWPSNTDWPAGIPRPEHTREAAE